MKNNILNVANNKKNCINKVQQHFYEIIIKNIDKFYCYYCLDTEKCWISRNIWFID